MSLDEERLSVPEGFRNLLENLTVEILRVQPKNIPRFAADFFKERLVSREENGYDDCLLGSQIDGFYRYEPKRGHATKRAEPQTQQDSDPERQKKCQREIKTQNEAAEKIQAGYHGYVCCKELKARNEAAVRIQSEYRWYKERKGRDIKDGNTSRQENGEKREVSKTEEKNTTCTIIQPNYRAYENDAAVSNGEQKEVKRKIEASITIQAGYRGYRDRKKMKKQAEASTTIQAGYRGYCVRKTRRAQSEAALKIQSSYRGYKVRKQLKQQQSYTSVLTVHNASLGILLQNDSRSSFSLPPEDIKFEGDLDSDSDADIDKVFLKITAKKTEIAGSTGSESALENKVS